MLVFEEGGETGGPRQKETSKQGREPTTKQPTYDAGPGIKPGPHWRERGECSHHCAIPPPPYSFLDASVSY